MKLENVKIGVKVQVKDGAPNTRGLIMDQKVFDGKTGVIVKVDHGCIRGLTVMVRMDDGTEFTTCEYYPWFSHKDLRMAKDDVIDLSLSEIEDLQLKVKMLEQKLQAIDDVLKGGNV